MASKYSNFKTGTASRYAKAKDFLTAERSMPSIGKIGDGSLNEIAHDVKGVAGRSMKGALKGGLIAGGLIGVGAYLMMSKRGTKFDPKDVPTVDPIPLMPTPEQMLAQQAPMMNPNADMGPAEGYQPNQWQNMVASGRGQQIAPNASQPRMSAISPDNVQNLGGSANPSLT